MIYSASSKGGYKIPGYFDKDSKRMIGIIYRPEVWQANTVYVKRSDDDYDIVMPSVFKGFYFKVTKPGKTGASEPLWPDAVGDTVVDGATFEAVAYNLLPLAETIVTSNFVASHGVTLTDASSTAGTTQVMISAVPLGVTAFTITNHTVKSNGEEDDVTLAFRVAER